MYIHDLIPLRLVSRKFYSFVAPLLYKSINIIAEDQYVPPKLNFDDFDDSEVDTRMRFVKDVRLSSSLLNIDNVPNVCFHDKIDEIYYDSDSPDNNIYTDPYSQGIVGEILARSFKTLEKDLNIVFSQLIDNSLESFR